MEGERADGGGVLRAPRVHRRGAVSVEQPSRPASAKRATGREMVSSGAPTFVVVVNAAAVVGDDASVPGHETAPEPFDVVLVDGVRVRVPVRFDDAAVARLVVALERR